MHYPLWPLFHNKQVLDWGSHLAMQDMSGLITWKNHDSEQSIVGENGERIYLLAQSWLSFPTDQSLVYEEFIPLNTQAVAPSATTRETASYTLWHRSSHKSGNEARDSGY